MTDHRKSPSVRPLRQLFVRTGVLMLLLVAAAVFGSRSEISCGRDGAGVDCRVSQGVDLPWSERGVTLWSQGVEDLRETRWQRRGQGRDVSQPRATVHSWDVLLLIGHETLEVGWLGAGGPVDAFLRSDRGSMRAVEPLDSRGWLISRALLALAALALLDSLIILLFGNARIKEWIGPRPDPDAPLPTTGLAKIGPIVLLAGVVAVAGFFFVGHRFVGPLAEHKVAALHQAVETSDGAALERALEGGVSVHAVDSSTGRTALHLGARSPELLAVLLERGADPNVYDLSNGTPLHQAASWGGIRAVSTLLERGADPGAMDDSGWTALRLASAAGDLESVEALLAAGCDPTRQGPHGWTPLHDATAGNHPRIVEVLLTAGADPRARNENGHVAGDLASYPEVKDLLASLERAVPEA